MNTRKLFVAVAIAVAPLGVLAFDGEIDHCGNIEGVQETVPAGFSRLNNVCSLISRGGGMVPGISNGTQPCFGSFGDNLAVCRKQFYPAHCEELAPRDAPGDRGLGTGVRGPGAEGLCRIQDLNRVG